MSPWLPIDRVLVSEEQIERRVEALAAEISRDYADRGELLLVGVLRGAFIFLADLSRRLSIRNRVDFISVASYQGDQSQGVRLILDLRHDVAGQHVMIVEDIVDTGNTLAYLQGLLGAREPASLASCSLLRKKGRLETPAALDYLGFDIPDEWVVGYGLDYEDQHRTLPYVGIVDPGSGRR